jgi:hypothetical protein
MERESPSLRRAASLMHTSVRVKCISSRSAWPPRSGPLGNRSLSAGAVDQGERKSRSPDRSRIVFAFYRKLDPLSSEVLKLRPERGVRDPLRQLVLQDKPPAADLSASEDAVSIQRARIRTKQEVDISLETARKNIRESWDAIARADKLLARR